MIFTQRVFVDGEGNEIGRGAGAEHGEGQQIRTSYYRVFNSEDITGISFKKPGGAHPPE
ncbi:MAG: hypothetical protein R3B47_05000 [Bacteroidia bacterium]